MVNKSCGIVVYCRICCIGVLNKKRIKRTKRKKKHSNQEQTNKVTNETKVAGYKAETWPCKHSIKCATLHLC